MRLDKKVAIVTGGASGIGKASCERFAAEGATVVIADINEEKIEELVSTLFQKGHEAYGITCDVSNEFQVRRLIATTIEQFGGIDVLFNNAGVILPKSINDIHSSEWDQLFQTNVKSMFLTIKYAIEHLKRSNGSIINMASMTGVAGQQNNAAYSATKGAIIAMTKALAIDLAPSDVRVNAICPAGVKTPLLEKWFQQQNDPENARNDQDRSHMLGRTASTIEIANVALFLASEDSSFITGEDVTIDGGATLGYGSGPKPEWIYAQV